MRQGKQGVEFVKVALAAVGFFNQHGSGFLSDKRTNRGVFRRPQKPPGIRSGVSVYTPSSLNILRGCNTVSPANCCKTGVSKVDSQSANCSKIITATVFIAFSFSGLKTVSGYLKNLLSFSGSLYDDDYATASVVFKVQSEKSKNPISRQPHWAQSKSSLFWVLYSNHIKPKSNRILPQTEVAMVAPLLHPNWR